LSQMNDNGKLIDGREVSKTILEEVSEDVAVFCRSHRPPHLVVVIVGDNPASRSYVRGKVKAAKKCGIDSTLLELPPDVSSDELLSRIDEFNGDSSIDGILVQLPLPGHIDQQDVIERISPSKDVDGFHPYNMGRLVADKPVLVSCTPLGIMELLSRYNVKTAGKRAVVIGRSIIVGKPMALLLARKHEGGDATVTICHSRSEDIASVTAEADIIIAAVGRAGTVTGDMVKEGAVVIDVGINRVDDPNSKKGYRLVGDVDFESVLPKASLITPVPGGVGPMTIAMLMRNTLAAAGWAGRSEDEVP